jgi:glycosyltransferase involved in cell wall biosynthesis
MNIGFDAKRIFHNKTGLGAYSSSLAHHLVKLYPQHTFYFYTPPFARSDAFDFFEKQENVVIRTLPRPSWFWRSIMLSFFVRRDKLDVFHGLSGELPLISFRPKIKTIVTIHDVIFKSHPQYYEYWDQMIYHLKTKRSLSLANKIVAVSRFTKSEIIKNYEINAPIDVISPVLKSVYLYRSKHLKESEFKSLYNLRNGFFLYVGSFNKRKNIDVVISALSNLPDEKKKKLVIVSNDRAGSVLDTARTYGVEDWVRIEKDVDDKTLSLYYSFCSAVIYPSFIEGFGLPILEGIVHGAKVICSGVPAHKEAGGELPKFFDPYNSDELTDILSSLSFYERKSDKVALSHLNTFSPTLICGELMRLYAQK